MHQRFHVVTFLINGTHLFLMMENLLLFTNKILTYNLNTLKEMIVLEISKYKYLKFFVFT